MHAPITEGDVRLRRRHAIDFHDAVCTIVGHFESRRGGHRVISTMLRAYPITIFPELPFQLEAAGCQPIATFTAWDARAVERIDGGRIILTTRRPDDA